MSLYDTFFPTAALLREGRAGRLPYGIRGDDIRDLQKMLIALGADPGPVDGVYGLMTEDAILSLFRGAVSPGVESDTDVGGELEGWIRFDAKNGLDLRAKRHGGPVPPRSNGRDRYLPKRKVETPRLIVLHWTGGRTTAKSLRDSWAKTDRAVSSHGCIDLTGAYQYLPWNAWAYHAGWVNKHSVGLDIPQPVRTSRLNIALDAGYTTRVVKNLTGRGDDEVLELDPKLASMTRDAVFALCEHLGVPIAAPRGADGLVRHDQAFADFDDLEKAGFSGIVGHHHVERPSRRWDIAPWWGAIFDGTPAGD